MAKKADDKKSVTFEVDNTDEELEAAEDESETLGTQYNKFQFLELIESHDDAINEGSNDVTDSDENQQDEKPKNIQSSKSKGRKRRNKSKGSKKNQTSSNDNLEDLIRANINADVKKVDNDTTFKSNDSHFSLLKLDMRNLIAENELKRMFGRSVLKEEKSKDQKSRLYPTSSGSQRSRFVSSAYHDPRQAQSSSSPKMDLDELFNAISLNTTGSTRNKGSKSANSSTFDDHKPIYFKFVHEKSYQSAHMFFLQAAHQGNSEAIVHNLQFHPTHVESLIQLSDMIRVSEDYKAASELIERALFIFERGFHPRFNMSQANCRLSYKRPENRTFFITLFKHINYTNRRGLRRTPLEYTKLLLALDPENDPLFSTLLIDFYAIRSEEYDYLIEFYSKWQHLSKLPNMNLSLALAHFMKSRSTKYGKLASETSLKTADECLQKALLRYPNFIIPLLDACHAEPSSELKKCDYFDYSVYSNKYKTVPESVDLLVDVYVQRNCILWKTKSVLSWLERNVASLVERFGSKEIVDEGQQVEYWKNFQGPSPRNLLRHIVLSDLKVKIPPSATSTPILDIDPFPPESIESYSKTINTNQINNPDRDSTSVGLSSLFIRSILPSFTLVGQTSSNNQYTAQPNQIPNSEQVNDARTQNDAIPAENVEGNMLNLDPVQSSILNVLNSLSNLLTGAENHRQGDQNDQQNQDNNGRQ